MENVHQVYSECLDSNSQPSEQESPPIPTRPSTRSLSCQNLINDWRSYTHTRVTFTTANNQIKGQSFTIVVVIILPKFRVKPNCVKENLFQVAPNLGKETDFFLDEIKHFWFCEIL